MARFFILLLVFVTPMPSWGATRVEYSAPAGLPFIASANRISLPDGNEVRLGYFDIGFDPSAQASDLVALQSAWNPYAGTVIGTNATEPGRFDMFAEQSDAHFDNKKAYFWIFETSDDSSAVIDFSNVVAYGLFSGEDWSFPVQGSLPSQATLTINTGTSNRGVSEAIHGTIEADKLRLQTAGSVTALTYAQWATDLMVFEGGISAIDKLPTANPDGDELTNLEEYFHRLRPTIFDVSPVTGSPSIVGVDDVFDITFPRRKNLEAVTYSLETATHFSQWERATIFSETVTSVDAPSETVLIRVQITDDVRRFFRLTVTSL
ncbi:MAG: hypothetical protein ACI8T1_003344 [Verrucomicrobiales bacterium]|jgi:hypothetical protein